MASEVLGRQLGTTHSPEQIDALARSAAAVAIENAGRGEVQGVFLSKDQQTIALKQAFGISEVGVQDALARPPTDDAPDGPQPVTQPPQEAPAMVALSR